MIWIAPEPLSCKQAFLIPGAFFVHTHEPVRKDDPLDAQDLGTSFLTLPWREVMCELSSEG